MPFSVNYKQFHWRFDITIDTAEDKVNVESVKVLLLYASSFRFYGSWVIGVTFQAVEYNRVSNRFSMMMCTNYPELLHDSEIDSHTLTQAKNTMMARVELKTISQ